MHAIFQDLRFAIRGILRAPGLIAAICLSLGLSMGANTTVFSWMRSMVLDPFPTVPEADRLVVLNLRTPEGADAPISYPIVRDWQETAPGFSSFGIRRREEAFVSIAGCPVRVTQRVAPLAKILTAVRRGSFRSVDALTKAINRFVRAWTDGSRPLVWVRTAEQILPKP